MTEAAKRPSVFGFLKSIVAEDVPDKPAARNTPVPAASHAESHVAVVHEDAVPDAAALGKLEQRLQAACPKEYASFMEQYESLKEDIADERTRFKVALKTTHTTAENVLAGVDMLLTTMQSAKEEFQRSFDENSKKKMSAADESIAATNQLIASSEEQIKAIEEKIAALKQKRETDIQQRNADGGRLETVLRGFNAAHAQVVSRLENQKSRLAAMKA